MAMLNWQLITTLSWRASDLRLTCTNEVHVHMQMKCCNLCKGNPSIIKFQLSVAMTMILIPCSHAGYISECLPPSLDDPRMGEQPSPNLRLS